MKQFLEGKAMYKNASDLRYRLFFMIKLPVLMVFLTANVGWASDSDVTLSGQLKFAASANHGGKAYLIIGSPGSTGVPGPQVTEGKEQMPSSSDSFSGILPIGSVDGHSHSFSISLPPGKYQISALIKMESST